MKTSYALTLKHFNGGEAPNFIQDSLPGVGVSIGSSLAVYNIHKFDDVMDANAYGKINRKTANYNILINKFVGGDDYVHFEEEPVGVVTRGYLDIGEKQLSQYLDSVTKAMLLAILDGDSKRTSTVGIVTSGAKKQIFYNTLRVDRYKDYSLKPWSNWNDSVGVCTPTSVSRSNNVAIVTTTPAHGMSSTYDDWGVIMNLNTGIATSFNISTSTYPNGVPVKIIDANTFAYQNVGINTPTTAVVGIASIQVGWGGTSNNLHLYFT